MKKSLFILVAAISALFTSVKADITADWKMYMPYDEWPKQLIETPNRVYMLSRTFDESTIYPSRMVKSHSLFYYDKQGDEIKSINERANSNGNAVSCIAYNPKDKYLVVAYTDCNVDFIYDDGKVYNVPAVKIATIPGVKEINSVTIDQNANVVYLATTFGYISLDGKRHEVAESRNYGENISQVGKTGDKIIMVVDGKILYAPASDKRYNITDYTEIADSPAVAAVMPIVNGKFFAYTPGIPGNLYVYSPDEEGYTWKNTYSDPQFWNFQNTTDGYIVTGHARIYKANNDGNVIYITRPESEASRPAVSLSFEDFWTLTTQKGLRKYSNKDNWKLEKDYMRPNAPATYIASSATYHPTYGMLVGSNGPDHAFSELDQRTLANVSALKGGFWKEYGPKYTNPGLLPFPYNFFGIAIDPKNPKYIYRGSVLEGMMRINLEDPNDIFVLGNPACLNAGSKNYIKVVDNLTSWSRICFFTTPQFTADGTMWTVYNNHDKEQAQLWYWTAADRAASTSAATYRPMKKIDIPKFTSSNQNVMIMLSKNPTMSVIGGFGGLGSFIIYDHRGTPDNTSDDRYVFYNTPIDQDGSTVSFLNINNVAEDPETGVVWILSQRGLFTVNPATAFDNPNQVNRIKVARNDGTNLADYLLNEINVNHMSIDGEGRKWFGTSNGLVCTSSDGRTILGEFTVENSYLPNDNVFATAYNPENNSMIVCTDSGVVEMFPSGSGSGSSGTESKMRVYPNPVEPDYYGWVRIDNVADGSLVKITDSKGGIVKELGPVQGGSVEWDVSGLNNKRVSTGVYYVMVSPGSAGGNTEISKILVLN